MGVGSTGVAALNLNRQFIGVEIDEKYFKAAEERLNGRPQSLFDNVNKNTYINQYELNKKIIEK